VLQFVAAHQPGREDRVAVVVVFPVPVHDPVPHGFEQGRAGKRRDDGQLDGVDTGLFKGFQGFAKYRRGVMVKAHHDARLDVHAVPVKRGDCRTVFFGRIEGLLLGGQRVGVERFESDEHPDAARALHGREQRLVIADGE